MFVDAGELGKSRGRTNRPVAGIHYYRRENAPRSTIAARSLSPTPFVVEAKAVELFRFVLFFGTGQTWVYFIAP